MNDKYREIKNIQERKRIYKITSRIKIIYKSKANNQEEYNKSLRQKQPEKLHSYLTSNY